MEAEGKIDAEHAIEFLARKRRAILLGGAAVILHGLSRATKDFDIWLDPYPEAKVWSEAIEKLLEAERSLQALRINSLFPGVWTPVAGSEIAAVGNEDGMIRLVGTDMPLDIFQGVTGKAASGKSTEGEPRQSPGRATMRKDGMLIGYARVSKAEAQDRLRQLAWFSCSS